MAGARLLPPSPVCCSLPAEYLIRRERALFRGALLVSAFPGALSAFGWSDRVLAMFNEVTDANLELARVVRVERSACAAVFCGWSSAASARPGLTSRRRLGRGAA